MFVINDQTPNDDLFADAFARGAEPRDYATHPPEMMAPPSGVPLIPRSEWRARVEEQEAQRSSLEHILRVRGVPSLDQNQPNTRPPRWGYCWCYSTTGAVVAARARDGLPHVALSAFGVAQQVMQGQDKGGWCGLSCEFIEKRGVPSLAAYPEWDTDWKKYRDAPAVWEDAARHKVTHAFRDIAAGHYYHQNLSYDQLISCLLLNVPCPVDFNWWGHSVLAVRAAWLDGEAVPVIRNSWGDRWGDRGFAPLQGQRKFPNSALALVSTSLSA